MKKEKSEKRTLTFTLTEMVVVVIIVSIMASCLTGYLVYENYNKIYKLKTNSISNIENSELKEFERIYNELKSKYVENVSEEELLEAATKGMFDYLDIYTNYLDEETTTDLQDRLNGEYKGIGVEIANNEKGYVEVVSVFEGTPAEEVGLKPGDYIISVNGVNMVGKTSSDVANSIKGNTNLKFISLVYSRNGKEKEVKIDINKVIIPSVEYKVFENNIGYIGLSTFSNTSYDQVKNSLEKLKESNITSLIIDLRGNTGGYLNSAKSIASLFLKKGDIIYQLKDRDGNIEKIKATTNSGVNYKIVILVNEASASASEILTLALKESYGATVVGAKTYGKGTVQDTEVLSNGTMIKYTTGYWLSPKGNSINEVGITPDVEVKLAEDKDNQLEKAKEVLKN